MASLHNVFPPSTPSLLSVRPPGADLCLPEVAAYWNQVVLMNDYEKKCFALKMIEKMFNIIAGEKIVILGFCIPEG